jgi:hypothetical protein
MEPAKVAWRDDSFGNSVGEFTMTVSAVRGANTTTTSTSSNTDGKQFAKSMNAQLAKSNKEASASGNGSPASAQNGTKAANDLLSSNNPCFYNRLLFKTDPGYSPETAKAQAFAATLYGYEQKGDRADTARFLNALGPSQAAKFFAEAGNLQGPQFNDSGAVFAKNQAGVDQVLGKALVAPGVKLGDGTRPGTLANSLLQQATQSGRNASSIAGILNGSGTSTQAGALKNEFLKGIVANGKALGNPTTDSAAYFDRTNYAQAALTVIKRDPTLLSQYQGKLLATYQQLQQNANPGIFASDGTGVPAADRGFLNGLRRAVDTGLYGIGGQSNKGPATGIINPSTQYGIQPYLAGKGGNGSESPSQRLANMMSVLGPSRMYAVLANTTTAQAQQLGIQSSLNTLTDNLQFTAADAKNLALAQASFATSQSQYNFPRIGRVGSLMSSLPKDQNGTDVKVGYAQGCITAAQQLAQEIQSGKHSGQVQNQLTATLNVLLDNATNLSARFPDPARQQLFSQLHAAATQLAGTGAAKQSDVLNAYAANILGSLSNKSQIAATLRAMGGVGANGAIDPNSGLGKFLQSALGGQSQLGIASYFGNNMTPDGQMPKGVTGLLNGISGSRDTKLIAGTLDTVMQWTIRNPTQAEVLASQDTGNGATGYRNALTSLLDKSFNRFVALDPSDPNAKLVRTMQPSTIADLQALSAVEMGPPYNSKVAGNFAGVVGKHAVQFAAYATHQAKYPQLDRLLAGGGDPRNSAAVIFGQLMNGFDAGLIQSQASFQAQAHDTKAAADQTLLEARVVTDLLRGFGTGTLLASAWITGGAAVPIGLGAVANGEKLASIFGRVGLFSGSVGTVILDAFFSNNAQQNQAQAEQQAVQAVALGMQTADVKPTQALQQIYNGWFSNISQTPGKEGQRLTDGVMTGSSFAGAPTIQTDVRNFYSAYNPQDYYFRQTGEYPSAT